MIYSSPSFLSFQVPISYSQLPDVPEITNINIIFWRTKLKTWSCKNEAELFQHSKLPFPIQCLAHSQILLEEQYGQYLTLISPDRGEISFLKEFPIWAAAKGNFPWLNSKSLLKFRKIPCAVSGLKYL